MQHWLQTGAKPLTPLPPDASTPGLSHGFRWRTVSYDKFLSSELKPLCALCRAQIINNDPSMHVFYTLKVAFQYTDVVMAAAEQTAVKSIWDKCARLLCSEIMTCVCFSIESHS